ncbi:MAG: MFS transporter, partial [Candidatus Omnitrophica bacterium]|nr:MFS transporter [Candidatus Omnitrophota bacterium]
IINIFVFLHSLMFIPLIFIPYIFKKNPVFFLILFVVLLNSFNAFAGPAWTSLISEYIPQQKRGRFFGKRNKLFQTIVISASFIAGFILFFSKQKPLKGFAIIFGLAFIFRMLSWYFLTQMYEPPFKSKPESYFSFLDFIKRIGESNFLKFVIFVSSLNFSVNIAAPFFSVFMLKDLKFNYLTYTVLVTTVAISSILMVDRWGRNADRVGNVKILKTTSYFIISLPFLWIINQSPFYLFFIQVLSGFAWSGFNLSAVNFILDAVTPQKRTRCVAYFNVFNGVALCLGAFLGGTLVKYLPLLRGYKILSLFLVSSSLRCLVVILLSPKIREVRMVEKTTTFHLLLEVIGLKPRPCRLNQPTSLSNSSTLKAG